MRTILEPMIFFLISLVCISGIWALLAPQAFLRLNRLCSTWVETRGFETKLSANRFSLDRLIYRHHLISGSLLLVASLGLLYLVLFHLAVTPAKVEQAVAYQWFPLFYESLLSFACLAGIIGMIVGMIVFIRPSSLKLAESWGNQSVSLQPLVERLERRFDMVDLWVERHTRLFGGMVVLFACLIGLLVREVMR
ncbi:MAG TPA: hypothetical protein VFX02_00170 [Gammaproteobacteria bacterium]|nr:hypothetical protein [Gammaproteobacteria bacterium]